MANYRVIGNDGREYGPVTLERVRTWIGEGRIQGSTLVCAEGSLDWRPLAALPEFQTAPGALGGSVRAPGVTTTNGWAVWGFVCGLLSLTLCSCCCLPLDLMGIVFSTIALVQISNQPQTQGGTALAVTGLVLSLLSFVLGFAFSALWFASGAAEGFMRELEREFIFAPGGLPLL